MNVYANLNEQKMVSKLQLKMQNMEVSYKFLNLILITANDKELGSPGKEATLQE